MITLAIFFLVCVVLVVFFGAIGLAGGWTRAGIAVLILAHLLKAL